MAIFGEGTTAGAGALTSVVPAWLVVGPYVVIVLLAVRLGGLSRNFNPAYWLREYRSGRTQAAQEE